MRDFDATVKAYSGWLMVHVRRKCEGSFLDPEELYQETLIDAWKLWPKISGYQRIGGILMKIMHWTASRMWRLRRMPTVDLGDWDASVEPTQEAAVEVRQIIGVARDRLSGKTFDMLSRMAMGDTCREIAADYGVVHQAVQQRVEKGRRELRRLTA